MCGIIGYIGYKDASPVLLNGLRRMEYRGYDSAGIVSLFNRQFQTMKGVGRIDSIHRRVHFERLQGNSGIAHTRWATHGRVTKTNAHPHLSCGGEVAIVHNGIIDNYQDCKNSLIKAGHEFRSDTDSEIIAHLLEKHRKTGMRAQQAVLATVRELKGAFAFLAMLSDETEIVFGARKDAPIVVGVGQDENFISSDVLAFIDHTDRAIFLDNNEIALIGRDRINLLTFEGEIVRRKPVKVAWEAGDASKGGYSHHTLKEIHDQPSSIHSALIQDDNKLQKVVDLIGNADHLVVTGAGTSFHAALIAKYLFSKFLQIRAEAIPSSEFDQVKELLGTSTTVLAISQSGETADILDAVRKSKSRGAKIISIVNAVGSSLVRESYETLYANCGPEIGVAATKSFTAQLAIINLILWHLSSSQHVIEPKVVKNLVVETLKTEDDVKNLAGSYRQKDVYFVGRGIHHAIALEGALKLKELAYLHAEGMAAGELKHGTLALIQRNTPVVALNPKDETYSETLGNISEMKARGARVIGVSDVSNELYDDLIRIPSAETIMYPILEIIPLQLLAYYSAVLERQDPDFPRNLAKSVTVK